MSEPLLIVETDKRGVAAVKLNRPEVHNAFDDRLIAELTDTFGELGGDPKVRLAVLSGNGKSFCAGGDLNWMKSMKNYTRAENVEDGHKLAVMFETIRRFSKPLIGVLHGNVLGGGSGLAACCDYVIATRDAKFGFTEVKLGLIPATISPYVIEKIGAANARAYFLSGAVFSAEVAKHIGLVQRQVTPEELEAAREEAIGDFLKAGPEAAQRAKALVEHVSEMMRRDGATARAELTQYTVEEIADVRVGIEGQEGMDALLSGRKPKWIAS